MRFKSLLLAAVLLTGCSSSPGVDPEVPDPGPAEDPEETSVYHIPRDLGDGWTVGHARDAGFDMALIERMIEDFHDGTYVNMHSIVVVKDGVLVVDEYEAGTTVNGERVSFTPATLHSMHSVAKSVNAALVGIALQRGLLPDVDVPVASFFPEYVDPNAADGREKVLLRHALSMTAGLDWDEWGAPYGSVENDHYVMDNALHPVEYVLTRRAIEPPGTVFVYNSGLSITLGALLQKASGRPLQDFSTELFTPLRIESYFWWTYPDGTAHTGGGLRLRPRDMAKIGELYRLDGLWQGEQLLAPGWVEASTQPQAPGGFYGYQWWIRDHEVAGRTVRSFRADGLGGQYIFVVKALGLVVVFTQGNPNGTALQAFDILEDRLIAPLLP